jgi:hypothetical protein
VIRRNPAGGFAMAVFLIDIWCIGLKDAFGRIDLLTEDVKSSLDRARGQFELTRIDIETARQLVAGAIRFSRQNGFRLPAHFDRFVNILGGVGDVAQAELTEFGIDGKLRFVGSICDLQRRLIGSTPEAFLAHSDVEFIAGPAPSDEWDEDEEDDFDPDEEPTEEILELAKKWRVLICSMTDGLANDIRQKMIERGQTPPELANEAVRLMYAAEVVRSVNDERGRMKGQTGLAHAYAAGMIVTDILGDNSLGIPQPLKDATERIATIFFEEMDKLVAKAEALGLVQG